MKRFLYIMICCVLASGAAFAQDAKKKKEVVNFKIEEMHCNNCVKKIEKNIAFEKGVADLKCDLESHTAEVTYKSDKTDLDKIIAAFKKIGMTAVPIKEEEPSK